MDRELGDLQAELSEAPEARDARLRAILEQVRRVVVVGASNNPLRASQRVVRFLQEQGLEVLPVANESEVQGLRAYPRLADVPGPVDLVDVFCRPPDAPRIAAEAAAYGAPAIWFQDGIASPEACAIAERAGMRCVMDRCLMREYRVLMLGEPRQSWFPV